MREAIDENALKALIAGRGVSDFLITQDEACNFVLSVRYTGATRWLPVRSREKNPRTWASAQTVSRYLWRLGVRSYSVELSSEPKLL
jgi:hypothetical protein